MDRRAVRGRAGGRVELSDDRFLHCRRRDAALVPALDRGRWRADRRSGTRRGRGSRGRIARTGRGAGCAGGARMRDRRTVAHLLVGCRAQRQELRLRTVYETGRAGGRRVDAADDGRRRGVGDGYDLSFLGACRTCRRDDLQCVGGRRVGGDDRRAAARSRGASAAQDARDAGLRVDEGSVYDDLRPPLQFRVGRPRQRGRPSAEPVG